ncbi:type II toxin-antitoxin system death-on-curing family toxin [Agriterribacter sp.]|uniref:type II toxin-antitoxin system death-on-curing family toxin n=1 Tax=Agriterribacter sp. TaxID=2821509 RepID=UPI002C5FD29C|nr:type II toxin-antitoxin system death-on-curing family toxin [Agriterribacter sp.]HRO48468.1 type II toxin-antitoxin system death-on-curing family toxin [Agriterribacter sp.]
MISIEETEKIHKVLVDTFGGTHGIRDLDALQSALSRPFQTFDNADLYPGVLEKAASLIESLLNNHPFVDGNKRTGYVLTRLFLLTNKYNIEATQQDKYDFVISIASGKIRYKEILIWLESHTKKQTDA